MYCVGFENSQWRTQTSHNNLFFSLLNLDMVPRNSPFCSYRWKRGWSWPCFDTTLPALLCQPQPHVHSKVRILSRQLEWIPQNQVGHLIYVYYTTLCFTIFMQIYWARELLEKWGNQSKRQSSARKRVESVFSTKVQWLGLSTVLKQVTLQYCNDQRPVKYVKINRSRQLALDGVVDMDVDYWYIKWSGFKSNTLPTVFFCFLSSDGLLP